MGFSVAPGVGFPPRPWTEEAFRFAGLVYALASFAGSPDFADLWLAATGRPRRDLVLTSYYRTREQNATLAGASSTSLHLEGLAADWDLVSPGAPFGGAGMSQLFAFGQLVGIVGDLMQVPTGVLVYDTAGKSYVHVQGRPLLSGRRVSIAT